MQLCLLSVSSPLTVSRHASYMCCNLAILLLLVLFSSFCSSSSSPSSPCPCYRTPIAEPFSALRRRQSIDDGLSLCLTSAPLDGASILDPPTPKKTVFSAVNSVSPGSVNTSAPFLLLLAPH